ncbi:MAG: hypothetical protein IKM61_04115 [Eubacteriaceae bacterium]|nr:hypothetical protein [Eubacteriaceae bacterium]
MKKLTAILLIILSLLTFSSCEKMTVEDSAAKLCEAIKAKDEAALLGYVDGLYFYEPELSDVLTDALYLSSRYTVGNITEVDSKNKTVDITFENIDINTILTQADALIAREGFDEKNIDSDYHTSDIISIYTNVLRDNAENYVTKTVSVSFVKKSGNWIAQFDEDSSKEFMGAFFGGYEF